MLNAGYVLNAGRKTEDALCELVGRQESGVGRLEFNALGMLAMDEPIANRHSREGGSPLPSTLFKTSRSINQ